MGLGGQSCCSVRHVIDLIRGQNAMGGMGEQFVIIGDPVSDSQPCL